MNINMQGAKNIINWFKAGGITAIAVFAVSTSFATDITFYGFVSESGHVKKELSQSSEVIASFGIVSNFGKGVTLTVDIFDKDGKNENPKGAAKSIDTPCIERFRFPCENPPIVIVLARP